MLATPLTPKSQRYRKLIENHASGITIDEPNTAGWAAAIEHERPEEISLDAAAQECLERLRHRCTRPHALPCLAAAYAASFSRSDDTRAKRSYRSANHKASTAAINCSPRSA